MGAPATALGDELIGDQQAQLDADAASVVIAISPQPESSAFATTSVTEPTDPAVLAAVAVLLGSVVVAATLLPVRGATRVEASRAE